MGKYKTSDLHAQYSDWHYNLIKQDKKYKRLICSDIDRIWLEYDLAGNEVLCVLDLKFEESFDNLTATEEGLRRWFIDKGARFYVVYVKRDFSSFRVVNERGEYIKFKPLDFADWLLLKRKVKKDLLF